MSIYSFNAQQPSGSTMCGAFALCALLGEKGYTPSDIVGTLHRGQYRDAVLKSKGELSNDEFAAMCVYNIVKSNDLSGYCSPKLMVDFAKIGFGLRLQIKTPKKDLANPQNLGNLKKHVEGIIYAPYTRIPGPQIITTIIGNPTIWYEGIHFIMRSLRGYYVDSGKGFGDTSHSEEPYNKENPRHYSNWGPFWIE